MMEDTIDTAKREKRFRLLSRFVKFQLAIAILAIIIGVIAGFQIVPLIKQKNQLELEVKQKSEALKKVTADLEDANSKLQEAAPLVNLSAEDIGSLKDLAPGLEVDESKGQSLTELIEESRKATSELQSIKSTTADNRHRSSVLIRYYPKRADRDKVQRAIEVLKNEYGFRIEIGESREKDTPINAICLINEGLLADDIKVIAYNLIRFGTRIQYIGPYPDPNFLQRLTGNRVFVLGEKRVLDDPPLTVAQIRAMTLEQMWMGTKKLDPISLPK